MSEALRQSEDRYSNKNILKRIFVEEVKPNSKKFIIAIVCMIMTAICITAQAYVLQPALDEAILAKTDLSVLNKIAAFIIVITLVKALSQYKQGYIMLNMNVVITNSLRSKMFKHFINSDISTHGKKSSAGMISNIINDTSSVMALISLFLTGAFLNVLTVVGLLGNMLYQNYFLTILAFTFFPLAFYPIYKVTRRIKKLVIKNQRLNEKYYSVMNDSLSSIKVIKSYNAENNEISRFDRVILRIYRLNKKINKIAVFPYLLT